MCAPNLPRFGVTLLHESRDVPVVAVFGEVDLTTIDDFDAVISEGISKAGDGGSVVLDLTGVEFIEVIGLNALIRAQNGLREVGGSLALVFGGSPVGRLLEIADLADHFDSYGEVSSAVRGCLEREPASR